MCCLSYTCRAYHQAMDISGINKDIKFSCALDTAEHKPLCCWQVLPTSPFVWFIVYFCVGFFNFLFVRKTRCAMLPVTYGSIFDSS